MRVVHGLLRVHGEGVHFLGSLVDGHLVAPPIGKHIVGRHPDQVLVSRDCGKMARHLAQDDERGARRVAAHGAQDGIDGLLRVGDIDFVAVD